MVCDIPVVGLDRWEGPVVEGAWIVLAGVDAVVLDGARVAEKSNVELLLAVAIDQ